MRLTVSEMMTALAELGPALIQGGVGTVLTGLATDSRSIKEGEIFLALSGDNFDGHDFVPSALAKGAAGAVVRSGWSAGQSLDEGATIIEAGDTLIGLNLIARHWRLAHPIPILAITGSLGKSSVKEMVAAILAVKRRILKNRGNYNNTVGLPLTLLELEEETEAAVVELGVNGLGPMSGEAEMARLVDTCRPQVGLITNIGPIHLEGLGDLDGVARTKTVLWRNQGPETAAVVNLDDPMLVQAAEAFDGPKFTFGQSAEAQVRLKGIRPQDPDGCEVELSIKGEEIKVLLPTVGLFQGFNAAAACAGALAMGAGTAEMIHGLASFESLNHRLRIIPGEGGLTIIDDAYNANPPAMPHALKTLTRLCPNGHKAAAVLGQMAELGRESEAAHRRLGEEVGRSGVDLLIALGPWAEVTVAEARAAGLKKAQVAPDREAAAQMTLQTLEPGDWVLIKGSRMMGMEKIVDLLTGGEDGT